MYLQNTHQGACITNVIKVIKLEKCRSIIMKKISLSKWIR